MQCVSASHNRSCRRPPSLLARVPLHAALAPLPSPLSSAIKPTTATPAAIMLLPRTGLAPFPEIARLPSELTAAYSLKFWLALPKRLETKNFFKTGQVRNAAAGFRRGFMALGRVPPPVPLPEGEGLGRWATAGRVPRVALPDAGRDCPDWIAGQEIYGTKESRHADRYHHPGKGHPLRRMDHERSGRTAEATCRRACAAA